ncbi:hypothetical protein ABZZ36_30400 [Actinacidiphila glaucinigra]|uniref:hypothetical protein n=1 Tax=Actinacidiphila glaucinigra TaxID=235986 RepID=UPI0033A61B0E
MAGVLNRESKKARPATTATSCAKCNKAFSTGESLKSEGGRFYHLACFYMRTSRAVQQRIRQQAEEKRADQEARADAAAGESMRSHKPSDWRLGKSPSDYR